MIGFGCDPPQNPHHRDSALTLDESGNKSIFYGSRPNANELTGAMVGGPDEKDDWKDDRNNYRCAPASLSSAPNSIKWVSSSTHVVHMSGYLAWLSVFCGVYSSSSVAFEREGPRKQFADTETPSMLCRQNEVALDYNAALLFGLVQVSR